MFRYVKFLLLITLFCTGFSTVKAEVFYKVVAADGSGDSYTIKSALPRYPSGNTRYIIYVKNGVYEGQLTIALDNVSIIGESADGVIITNGFYNGDTQGSSTASSATCIVSGDNFYCENVTFKNSAGNVGQAVAIRPEGEQQVFNNCKFIGFQDTYYAYKRSQYNYNCLIQGATDFIFGESTCVFDSCTVMCVSGGQYVTAPADSKYLTTQDNGNTMIHGLLFNNSLIKKASGVSNNSYYLGRPWQNASSSVFKNCTMESHINTIGWYEWNATVSTVFCAEYKSVTPEGSLISTSGRASWSKQLADSIADKYYNIDYFFNGKEGSWNPKAVIKALSSPENIAVDNYEVSWNVVDGAAGYVIIRNDSTVGFSETTSFSDATVNPLIANEYTVKSVNTEFGNLSEASESITVAASGFNAQRIDEIDFYVANKTLQVNTIADIQIYSLSGQLVKSAQAVEQLKLGSISGMYICKLKTNTGTESCGKIIL